MQTQYSNEYNIGFVSKTTDLAISTIKTWERRYGIIQEKRNVSGRLYYNDADIEKLKLVKRLKENGASISAVAHLPNTELHKALSKFKIEPINLIRTSINHQLKFHKTYRINSKNIQLSPQFKVVKDYDSVSELLNIKKADLQVDLILLAVTQIQENELADIIKLSRQNHDSQTILCYTILRIEYLNALLEEGIFTIRLPLPDNIILQYIEAALAKSQLDRIDDLQDMDTCIEHLFTEEEVQAIARYQPEIKCECPKHITSLITSLSAFEAYSNQCINESPHDTGIHEYLFNQTGTARAILEQALLKLCNYDNIDISAITQK